MNEQLRSTDVSPARLARFFSPKSVALVGATDKSGWSASAFQNFASYGFTGDVYLVNPRGNVVHGQQAYASVLDIPGPVDLAYVMVPTKAVLPIMTEVAAKGIRNVVVLAAGFGEMGDEGKSLESTLYAFCEEHGITLLGPNTVGFVNAMEGVTPYGLPIPAPLIGGNVGVILQSGGLANFVLAYAQSRNIGLSVMTSMGNETQLRNSDVLRYMVEDPQTKVIAMFVESIRNPKEFLEIADLALARAKPIIVLKVGRSEGGARVAKAHTGALVGDDAVIDTAFRQHGVLRVNSLEDLVNTAGLLASLDGPLPGRRIGFLSVSGGACEIVSDRAADEGVEIPAFNDETIRRLGAIIPDFGSVQNPLDVTGYVLVDQSLLGASLSVVGDDPNVDVVVTMFELPRESDSEFALLKDQYRLLAEILTKGPKPIVLMGGSARDVTALGRSVAVETNFPFVLGGIDHGVTALARAMQWSDACRRLQSTLRVPSDAVAKAKPARVDVNALASARGIEGRSTWAEHHAAAFLADNGVPMAPRVVVADASAAVSAAEKFGYPVVVKLAADNIEHKTDIGGVKLNLNSAAEVREAFDAVVKAGHDANADVVGALVQPMRPHGLELLCGIVTDPAWGHVLAVGLGGVWVEALRDVALRVLPVSRDDVLSALKSLRGARLFDGIRGEEPADLEAVTDAVLSVAKLAHGLGEQLESLEINPLLVRGSNVEALDALITWRP